MSDFLIKYWAAILDAGANLPNERAGCTPFPFAGKKIMRWIPILLLLAPNSFAQTNEFKTVTVTNWVRPNPEIMRVVNGQLYNTYYSILWGEPRGGAGIDDDSGHFIRYETIPISIEGNKTFCKMEAVEWWYDYLGRPKDEDRYFVKKIVIYNAPTNVILGLAFKFKCMKSPDLIEGNQFICQAYDCGTPYTNLVPVVTKKKIRDAATP